MNTSNKPIAVQSLNMKKTDIRIPEKIFQENLFTTVERGRTRAIQTIKPVGYHPNESYPQKGDIKDPDEHKDGSSRAEIGRVLNVLLWYAVGLGILPGGRRGPQKTVGGILKTLFSVLTTLFLSVFYIGLHNHVASWEKLSKTSFTYWFSEFMYALSISVPSWITMISFWLNSKAFILLLERFRDLPVLKLSLKVVVAKIGVIISLFLLNVIFISNWYLENYQYNLQWGATLFIVSYSWQVACTLVPSIFFVILGSFLSAAFAHTNSLLDEALLLKGKDTRDANTKLRNVYQVYVTLRNLYHQMATILNLPMFGFYIFTMYYFSNSAFYVTVVLLEKDITTNTNGFMVSFGVAIVVVSIVAYTANDVEIQASAAVTILEQGDLNISAESSVLTWNEDPILKSIYKLCDHRLTFSVCGLFNISRSTVLQMLNVAASYVMIFLQFHLLERPTVFQTSSEEKN